MKFLELVGNASTTVLINEKYFGHNVNAAAYINGNDIIIKLENNGSPIKGVKKVTMSHDEYAAFKYVETEGPLFIRGIKLFGGVPCL